MEQAQQDKKEEKELQKLYEESGLDKAIIKVTEFFDTSREQSSFSKVIKTLLVIIIVAVIVRIAWIFYKTLIN